jgi:UDP-N-acetylmuramyl pentapeptide synthase
MAIVTNVGPVHIEFFNNEEEIALAKSEIFLGLEEGGFALINADNRHFDFLKNRLHALEISQVISFGQRNNATYQIIEESLINDSNSISSFCFVRNARMASPTSVISEYSFDNFAKSPGSDIVCVASVSRKESKCSNKRSSLRVNDIVFPYFYNK